MVNKCSKCNKVLKSVRALAQHQADKHRPANPSGGRRTRPRPRRRPAMGGVEVNPSKSRTVPGESMVVAGEDRLDMVSIKQGTTFYQSFPITAGSSLRLNNIAKAFQRIRWQLVSVTVTPQVSVMVSGGYVAGFIMDPSDATVSAAQLSATQNSKTKKWYESCVINMPQKRDLLYTSTGEDPRLSIPAIFWLITEGPPTSDVNVVLTFNWKVHLTEPTVEMGTDLSFLSRGEVKSRLNNYDLELFVDGKATTDFSNFVPEPVRERTGLHFWRVPTFNVEYAEGTGDTGTLQMHFIVYQTSDKKLYYSANGRTLETTVWQANVDVQVVIPCGTYCKYAGSGNLCRGGRSAPPSLPSKALSPSCQELIQVFSNFIKTLSVSSESSRDDWIELSET